MLPGAGLFQLCFLSSSIISKCFLPFVPASGGCADQNNAFLPADEFSF